MHVRVDPTHFLHDNQVIEKSNATPAAAAAAAISEEAQKIASSQWPLVCKSI